MEQIPTIIATALITFLITAGYYVTRKKKYATVCQEYTLELVNQDTVKIYSHSSEVVYTIGSDEIQEILEFDNM